MYAFWRLWKKMKKRLKLRISHGMFEQYKILKQICFYGCKTNKKIKKGYFY